jgi:hypothetical protein
MNDSGKTVKSILQGKVNYKLIRNKHRCVEVILRLELADDVPLQDINQIVNVANVVYRRAIEAASNEFLPP